MSQPAPLSPLFTWFGGKRHASALIWGALGDPPGVIVPFAGGLGDLLGRPTEPRREVINDLDCFVVNFWRAVRSDPEGVWYWCDDLVSEVDVRARHRWLVEQKQLSAKLEDPDWFDAKIAGWWVWGLCAWIGAGWCDEKCVEGRRIPMARPGGIHRLALSDVVAVAQRLSQAVVTCGDWSRVLTPAYTTHCGLTGVILDPPYADGAEGLYRAQDRTVSARVADWAREHGDDPQYRIVLCGYEGEHRMPRSWRVRAWTARGGYGNQRKDRSNENRRRERLWLSPHCLPVPRAES